ncbi:hypothetical protein KXS12_05060 [Priestia filamentosa]|uniref:DUF6449 domain-containing protein n=1 Tax=Priestia filamentosa TaxID=1402861 RepID=UPI003F16DB7C
MRQKTSLFNKGIFVQDLRSVGWIGIVYFLLLVAVGPLQTLLKIEEYRKTVLEPQYYMQSRVINFFELDSAHVLLTFTVPVVLSIFLFRYLHTKMAANYIHSLPMKRSTLFHQRMLTGSLLLLLPLVIDTFIMFGIGQGYDLGTAYSFKSLSLWFVTLLLFNLFVFAGSTFVAMFTGMSLLQGALTYIMFILPIGIFTIILQYEDLFLFGFSSELVQSGYSSKIFPIERMANITDGPLSLLEWCIYILVTVFFYNVALLIYRHRKTEAATQAIVVRPLRPVFKYGVTTCFMLVGGVYFWSNQDDIKWLIVGLIIGSLIGYIIGSMILEKTWRIFSKWKGYIGFAIAAFIIMFTLNLDVFGYENHVPKSNEIKRVYISSEYVDIETLLANDNEFNRYIEESIKNGEFNSEAEARRYYKREFFKNKNDINNVIKLHKSIINDKEKLQSLHKSRDNMVIFVYELKDGSHVMRQYSLPNHKYENVYKPIVESDEYKENLYPVLSLKENEVQQIILTNGIGFMEKQEVISDSNGVKELFNLMKQDARAQTYGDIIRGKGMLINVEFITGKDRMRTDQIPLTFTKTIKWLKEHHLYDKVVPKADEFDYVVVKKYNINGSHEEIASTEEITDKNKINQLIKLSSDKGLEYSIDFVSKNGHSNYEVNVQYEDLPNDIKKQLN